MLKNSRHFLNCLFFSDFLLINNKTVKSQVKTQAIISSSKIISSLNLFTLNKNIKQFIKILLFLNKRKKKPSFLIYSKNKFLNMLLEFLLLEKELSLSMIIHKDEFTTKKKNIFRKGNSFIRIW